jgi:hypothetical protein
MKESESLRIPARLVFHSADDVLLFLRDDGAEG